MSTEQNAQQAIKVAKHDIKNQLSNISLSLEQLRFEIPSQTDDCKYYLDTIFESCKKINSLIENL